MHDATFWQPLALAQIAAHGLAPIPARIQSFAASQWGHVRGFALAYSAKGIPVDPGPPPFGVPSEPSYKRAAVDAIRATATRRAAVRIDSSPLAWNVLAGSLAHGSSAAGRLRRDVRVYLALNGALHDAAIAAWAAKRTYESPRPISMIRYLAFQGQSSDPKGPSYNRDGLPLFSGLIELVTRASSEPGQRHAALAADVGQVAVLAEGRWVLGSRWAPSAQTPASPGWVSEASAFAAAAAEALAPFTPRSLAQEAARLGAADVVNGIETAADASAGRALGTTVGKRARARALRYVPADAVR